MKARGEFRGQNVSGCSRCLWIPSIINVFASSTPLPARYANSSGSIRKSFALIMWCFRILSIAFIPREVRATGRRSFSAVVLLFLGMGITVECFHSWGTVLLSMDLWNRTWNTSCSCWAVPQDMATNILRTGWAPLSGSPEGSQEILCAKVKCRIIGIKFWPYHLELSGVIRLNSGVKWVKVIREGSRTTTLHPDGSRVNVTSVNGGHGIKTLPSWAEVSIN